jgi:hypothetical protein
MSAHCKPFGACTVGRKDKNGLSGSPQVSSMGTYRLKMALYDFYTPYLWHKKLQVRYRYHTFLFLENSIHFLSIV